MPNSFVRPPRCQHRSCLPTITGRQLYKVGIPTVTPLPLRTRATFLSPPQVPLPFGSIREEKQEPLFNVPVRRNILGRKQLERFAAALGQLAPLLACLVITNHTEEGVHTTDRRQIMSGQHLEKALLGKLILVRSQIDRTQARLTLFPFGVASLRDPAIALQEGVELVQLLIGAYRERVLSQFRVD